MLKDFAPYCKAVSVLLLYPREDLIDDLKAPGPILADTDCVQAKQAFAAFFRYLRKHPLGELQMRYTALFDLNPATSLNLACHLPADPREQARRMSRLQGVYAAAGYEKISSELPDYLPLLLEFIAIKPDAFTHSAVQDVMKGLGPLIQNLHKRGQAYALLLQPLQAEVNRVAPSRPEFPDNAPADIEMIPDCAGDTCHESI